MKPVIDYVHAKGLAFGLYTCSGTETCVGGRPGSFGHWEQDAAVFAEWGVDWVKQDFCNVPAAYKADPQPLYANMSAALNATGRAMAFSMCEWGVAQPWVWGDAIAQAWRMAGDHTGNWDSTKTVIRQSAAIPAENSGRPYGWNDMDMTETGCVGQCAHANGRAQNMTPDEFKTEFSMWAISASPLHFTAPLLQCTAAPPPPAPAGGCAVRLVNQLSRAQCTLGATFGCSDANATMWTAGGCRGNFVCDGVAVACDVNGTGTHSCSCSAAPPPDPVCKPFITDLQKEILLNQEALAVNQDVTPQGRPVRDGDLTVWARHLSDGSAAVALYNEDDAPASLRVDFADLGWPAGTRAAVRDVWAHADLGVVTDGFPAGGARTAVAPHATMLLRVTRA